jgi:hypothetical protein
MTYSLQVPHGHHGADIVAMPLRQRHRHAFVRFGMLPEFWRDPVAWAWNGRHPEDAADQAWLDANAPGWRTEIVVGQLVEMELPIGLDPSASFLEIDIDLVFSQELHRHAWMQRLYARQQDDAARRAHVLACRLAAAPGSFVCSECGGLMEAFNRIETARIAQFAFLHPLRGHRCPLCACTEYDMAASESFHEAYEASVSRVGLPNFGSPLWSEASEAEWLRRRHAPPEIVIEVEEG